MRRHKRRYGPFVYRFEDTVLSRREDRFNSGTGRWKTERSEVWLSRQVEDVSDFAGSNPTVLNERAIAGRRAAANPRAWGERRRRFDFCRPDWRENDVGNW